MRSVVDELKNGECCGICGSKEPFIEHMMLEGVHFLWCHKCHTITFFRKPQSLMKQKKIENQMNFYTKDK